jgi:tetratricopeptide (TPR) repeat protein
MSDSASDAASRVPPLTSEQRRVAAGQFEHANQVIAGRKSYNYGIHLLLSCCKLDPANLLYRQALRRTQKAKYHNNLRGSWLAWLIAWPAKARARAALKSGNNLAVLEFGEQVLCRNPWDVPTQMDMAEAADELGLLDVAIWLVELARQKAAQDPRVNRALAYLYEQRGNFVQASGLWELVRRAEPMDREAESKLKDLAAAETLVRGQYEASALHEGQGDRPPGPVLPAQPQRPHHAAPTAEGIDVLRARIEEDPTNVGAWLRLAERHRECDELEQAHAVLHEALGATGQAFAVMAELADLEIEPFRRNLAVAEEKLETKPDDEELRRLRLRLRKEINTRELELYRRKAERFPTDLGHRLEVGIRLLRAGLGDEAIDELEAARGDPHRRAQAAYYLGLAFRSRNDWDSARHSFEEALQHLEPGEVELRKDLLFQLANGAAQAGDLNHALELGQELAREDPAYRDVGRLLEDWQARLA